MHVIIHARGQKYVKYACENKCKRSEWIQPQLSIGVTSAEETEIMALGGQGGF